MIARGGVALLALSAPSAAAWASRSAADGPLGPARWSLSHDPLGAPNAGLGRGLTLNVNLDELCTRLLPQFAEAHPTNFIRCADVQQDVLLAAASWSHVHPRVAFVEHRGVGPAAEVRVAVSADDAGFMRGEPARVELGIAEDWIYHGNGEKVWGPKVRLARGYPAQAPLAPLTPPPPRSDHQRDDLGQPRKVLELRHEEGVRRRRRRAVEHRGGRHRPRARARRPRHSPLPGARSLHAPWLDGQKGRGRRRRVAEGARDPRDGRQSEKQYRGRHGRGRRRDGIQQDRGNELRS
jgi:hypothetical protein